MADIKQVFSPIVRLSYAHLDKPSVEKKDDGTEKKVYSAQLLIPKTGDAAHMAAIQEMFKFAITKLTEKFPNYVHGQSRGFKFPFRDGDSDPSYDLNKNPEYAGNWVVAARNHNEQPGLAKLVRVNGKNTPVNLTPEQMTEIYSGCWVIASLGAFAFENKANNVTSRGVSFVLRNVLKVRDDVALAAMSVKADVDFSTLPNLDALPVDDANAGLLDTTNLTGFLIGGI